MIEYVGYIFTAVKIVWDNKRKIHDNLVKTKIGKWIAFPFVLPYLIYVLLKLVNDPLIMKILDNLEKQRKITDYL
jgi:hypothetical protein